MTAPRTGPANPGEEAGEAAPRDTATGGLQAVFLERHSYRRRRLMDMARLLPLLGVGLLLVPLLWPEAGAQGARPVPMSKAITYVFSVWAGLIGGAVLFGLAARRWGDGGTARHD